MESLYAKVKLQNTLWQKEELSILSISPFCHNVSTAVEAFESVCMLERVKGKQCYKVTYSQLHHIKTKKWLFSIVTSWLTWICIVCKKLNIAFGAERAKHAAQAYLGGHFSPPVKCLFQESLVYSLSTWDGKCRPGLACADCAGWSESIHYAGSIMLVFSRDGSNAVV